MSPRGIFKSHNSKNYTLKTIPPVLSDAGIDANQTFTA